ncbi:unnamed protein product [Amoebophrya sp. A25]|nr:unnamed protein product [Amoebophrya sp. A25]|eukprot:GSA25T00028028001.1
MKTIAKLGGGIFLVSSERPRKKPSTDSRQTWTRLGRSFSLVLSRRKRLTSDFWRRVLNCWATGQVASFFSGVGTYWGRRAWRIAASSDYRRRVR